MSDDEKARPVPVRNFIDGAQLRKDIAITLSDLSNVLVEQPQLRTHYGEQRAKAERQVNDLKLLMEAAESKVFRKLRDGFVASKEKFTDKLLENEVAAHPQIVAIKRAINEAKQILEIAKSAYDAFDDRKHMLIQLGAKDRAEMESEMRIKIAGAAIDGAGDRAMAAVKRLRGDA